MSSKKESLGRPCVQTFFNNRTHGSCANGEGSSPDLLPDGQGLSYNLDLERMKKKASSGFFGAMAGRISRLLPFKARNGFYRGLYQYLARRAGEHEDLLFWNFGFADSDSDGKKLLLNDSDEKHRHSIPGLSFSCGKAESLPFEKDAFDVVINVESSHCYATLGNFLKEVHRVLRLNGYFLLADFRNKEQMDQLRRHLQGSGFQFLREEIITPHVLRAMELDHERKR